VLTSRALSYDSLAAFCEAAARVKCKHTRAVDSSSLSRRQFEMLHSLLFARDAETGVSAHLNRPGIVGGSNS
jgi:hypothetical protein